MVDYLKFRNSSPLPRKSKRFDGTRYKEYLYGSVESLDTGWADKIVDYNPDLKLNTNGFTKYVDRNVSMSTECGFDLKSSLNSNDVCASEDLNLSLSEYKPNESQLPQFVKNSHQSAILTPGADPSRSGYDRNMFSFVEYQNYEELQKKYDDLSHEYSKYKQDTESYLSDAEQYRSCKQKMCETTLELDSEDDPKHSLELLLDHIYSILSDSFGPDNTLVSHLEKFANIYVDYQNKTEVELATLRSKAEIVDSLDKLVTDKTHHDKLIEQKDKTIESLVDDLKTSKLDHAAELNRLRDEFDALSSDYQVKLEQYRHDLSKYMSENESLAERVAHWKHEYTKLLDDQHQILSQLPVATLKSSTGPSSSQILDETESKPNFLGRKPNPNPWVKSGDRPNDPGIKPLDNNKSSANTFDNKFLHSLVETLYKKNELAVDELRKKDDVIRKQSDAISKLKKSVKEWESDAVLWLDYVDQSSSFLKGSS